MNSTVLRTYQDLLGITGSEDSRIKFCKEAIDAYKASEEYVTARDATEYAKWRNPTIMQYQKLLYTMKGKAVPDNYTANHKCASNFFNRFITQENEYLLGNGVTFTDSKTKEKLGADFDTRLQEAGKWALIGAVSFGFWNYDHLEVFKSTEFCPLYDEEDGALKAGIRWWRINSQKPLRITLYELDGYTEYIIRTEGSKDIYEVHNPKRTYIQVEESSPAEGTKIYDYTNYPGFPIIPLWGNQYHQSEIVGIRGQIDAYDLIKSGFANDLDDCSMIYWTIQNAGGMTDMDLAKFIEHMKTVKAAAVDGEDGAKAEAHTLEVPYQSRETYLKRLENDMYNDFMALNVAQISAQNVTATQINAAYEPLNSKVDEFEYCVIDFIQGILRLIGIEDNPTFQRSKIVNQNEETQMVLMAANYLDDETILKKLPWLTPEEIKEIIGKRDEDDFNRFGGGGEE